MADPRTISFKPPKRPKVQILNLGTFSLCALVLFLTLSTSATAGIQIYVDADAPSGGDGASWETAYRYLQDALDDTVSGRSDEVWIAEGTYYPDDGDSVTQGDQNATFLLKDGVSLRGKGVLIFSGLIDPNPDKHSLQLFTIRNGSQVVIKSEGSITFKGAQNSPVSNSGSLLIEAENYGSYGGPIYVDADAPSGGDGTSWETAYRYLQDALDDTVSGRGDEVWVAEGTYYPDDGANVTKGSRTESFLVKDGVKVYGGFNGTETERNQRNWANNTTTLSGKIYPQREYWSVHVTTVETHGSVVFDGLTITGGTANGKEFNEQRAAAVYYGVDLESDVTGGLGRPRSTAILMKNSTVSDHTASLFGAVAYGGSWTVENCIFEGNSVTESGGVAYQGTWNVKGSTFSGNSAGVVGGVSAFSDWTSTDTFFSENSAHDGGVAFDGAWIVTNSFFINNSANYGGVAAQSSWTVTNGVFVANSGAGGVASNGLWKVVNSTFLTDAIEVAHQGSWEVTTSIFANQSSNTLDYFFRSMDAFKNHTDSLSTPTTSRGKNIIEGGISSIQMLSGTPDLGGEEFVIDADPKFLNSNDFDGADDIYGTDDDGLQLLATSPAIGQGDSQFLPTDSTDLDGDSNTSEILPHDILGKNRIVGESIDLGPYEYPESTFSLVSQSGMGGTVSPTGASTHPVGKTVTVTATPNDGYLFDSWSGSVAGTDEQISITLDQDKTISATFVQDQRDSDSDGLNNYEEATYGSDPNVADTSGDGLNDGLVASAGFDPTTDFSGLISGGNLAMDSNGNGLTDSFENAPNPATLNNLGYYTQQSLSDGRPGSITISADNHGGVTLELQIQRSNDLVEWSSDPADRIQIPLTLSGDKEFFRFAIPE